MTHWMEGDWPEGAELESEQDKFLKHVSSKIRCLANTLLNCEFKGDVAIAAVNELLDLSDEIDSVFDGDDPRASGWVGGDGSP